MERLGFKIARITAGYTQKSLAHQIGVSQQTIAKWESGMNAPQRMKIMIRLEDILNSDKEVLFPDVFR